MTDKQTSAATHTARVAMKAEPEWRDRLVQAAKVRDGGNISHLIRRSVDDTIEREGLLPESIQPQERAS